MLASLNEDSPFFKWRSVVPLARFPPSIPRVTGLLPTPASGGAAGWKPALRCVRSAARSGAEGLEASVQAAQSVGTADFRGTQFFLGGNGQKRSRRVPLIVSRSRRKTSSASVTPLPVRCRFAREGILARPFDTRTSRHHSVDRKQSRRLSIRT